MPRRSILTFKYCTTNNNSYFQDQTMISFNLQEKHGFLEKIKSFENKVLKKSLLFKVLLENRFYFKTIYLVKEHPTALVGWHTILYVKNWKNYFPLFINIIRF